MQIEQGASFLLQQGLPQTPQVRARLFQHKPLFLIRVYGLHCQTETTQLIWIWEPGKLFPPEQLPLVRVKLKLPTTRKEKLLHHLNNIWILVPALIHAPYQMLPH